MRLVSKYFSRPRPFLSLLFSPFSFRLRLLVRLLALPAGDNVSGVTEEAMEAGDENSPLSRILLLLLSSPLL